MYKVENDTLLQNLCNEEVQLHVDPDSREVLKMMKLVYSFANALAEYDDAGERYDRVSELLAPIYAELDSMLIENVCKLMNSKC